MDLHLGVVPHEALDAGRQVMEPEAVNGGHPNLAGYDVLDFLQPGRRTPSGFQIA